MLTLKSILLTLLTIIDNHGIGVPHCKNNFSLFSLKQILTPVYDGKLDGLLLKSNCSVYSPWYIWTISIGTSHCKNNFSVFSLGKRFYSMCAYSKIILLTLLSIICNHGIGPPHCKNNFSVFSLELIYTLYMIENWMAFSWNLTAHFTHHDMYHIYGNPSL